MEPQWSGQHLCFVDTSLNLQGPSSQHCCGGTRTVLPAEALASSPASVLGPYQRHAMLQGLFLIVLEEEAQGEEGHSHEGTFPQTLVHGAA